MLDEILRYKKDEIQARKSARGLKELKNAIRDTAPPKNFYQAITRSSPIHLIAEVKKASPSRGVIREDFNPVEIAKIYTENGASALSVLTDTHFFKGSMDYIKDIRRAVDLPILQKDFILDLYQVYEARAAQADAILLIAAVLEKSQFSDYHALATELGMSILCEVHTEKELERIVEMAHIIGINNRNLKTFDTDLEMTFRVIKEVPDAAVVVSESGIHRRQDVCRLMEAGVDAILVGESLMREKDIGAKVSELLGKNINR